VAVTGRSRAPLTRAYIGIGAFEQGVPTEFARCCSRKVTAVFPLSVLNDARARRDPAVRARIQRLAAGCR
jgi:hypothetical protein